jgi:hypothetical protein
MDAAALDLRSEDRVREVWQRGGAPQTKCA